MLLVCFNLVHNMKFVSKALTTAVVLAVLSLALLGWEPSETKAESFDLDEVDGLLCLAGDNTCDGQCDSSKDSCGRECVASSGFECNCDTGAIPNSATITCDEPPSFL